MTAGEREAGLEYVGICLENAEGSLEAATRHLEAIREGELLVGASHAYALVRELRRLMVSQPIPTKVRERDHAK